jgi:ketosteroid isomerase-like protein
MSADDNKRIMQGVFEELARGNGKPFAALMAEDFCWTVTGTTPWSRSYHGRQAVYRELLDPLYAQFADRYTNTAQRILADGEHVVVECRGRVTTKAGQPYHNRYCFVIRMEGGRMQELTEYLDTELVSTALRPPA